MPNGHEQPTRPLAATVERYKRAEADFAAAVEVEERFGAPLLLARTAQLGPCARLSRAGALSSSPTL